MINCIYQNQSYKIEYENIKKHTNYFSEENIIDGKEKKINLVDSFESAPSLDDETIQDFFDYLKNEKVNMTNNNILSLKFLSHKFDVIALEEKVDQYIACNYKSIVETILVKYGEKDLTENFQFNTYDENIISYHMSYVFDNKVLPTFPIHVLYRLLSKYYKKNNAIKPNEIFENDDNNWQQDEFKIIDFILDTITIHGKDAFILVNFIKISNLGIDHLIDKISEEPNEIINYHDFMMPLMIRHAHYTKEKQKKEVNSIIKSESSNSVLILNSMLNNGKINSKTKKFYEILSFLSKANIQSKQPIKIFESIFIPNIKTSILEFILQNDVIENNTIGFNSSAIAL